jgi:hypothetical protein
MYTNSKDYLHDFILNDLVYSEFMHIYTNIFCFFLKICSLPECRTLPNRWTATHCRAHCQTAADCRTHCHTLPDCRTQLCALLWCGSVRQCNCSVAALRRWAAVCGSVRGSVWQCARQRVAVCDSLRQCAAVCGSAHGCVQQCADVCGSTQGSVRQCAWECVAVLAAVCGCLAVCMSVRQCAAVRAAMCGRVRQCARGRVFAEVVCGFVAVRAAVMCGCPGVRQ